MTKKLEKSTLPFSKGHNFYWPTDFNDSEYCLSITRYASNKKDLFDSGELSENLEIFTKNWDFLTIIKSALYYYLDYLKSSRKKSNQAPFLWLDWYTLIFIFLNKNTSKKEIINIVKFFYEAPDEGTILGVKRAIYTFSLFPFVPVSEESLNNLLIFLKIDVVSRETWIKNIFKKQNLDDLIDFLISFDCAINKNFD